MMRLVAIVLTLFALPAFAADIFESEKAGYSLIYSDDWKLEDSGSPDNVALTCIHPLCEGTVRASVLAAADYRYATETPDRLFKRVHPDRFIDMVKANAASLGTIKELEYPTRNRIGNVEGFIGTFQLIYKDRRIRHMIYGMVLNKGYFYHIQFLSPEAPNADLQKIVDGLLDGFQVNEEKIVVEPAPAEPVVTEPEATAPVTPAPKVSTP